MSENEIHAALREILYGPPTYLDDGDAGLDDGDDVVDPRDGWELIPPTFTQLLDELRRIEKTYARTSWSLRRFEMSAWLARINESYGPFLCLDDLSSALESIDGSDAPGHPLLQPGSRTGRPKLSRAEFRNRCMIALAIDALKKAGLSINEGAKTVAHQLSKRNSGGVRIRTSTYSLPVDSWETVKNWREEIVRIAQGKGRHGVLIREMAADYLRQRTRLPVVVEARGIEPKAIAALFLEQIRPLRGSGKTKRALFPDSR